MNTGQPTIIAVIPARYASTRFPGKPLAPIRNKPMIQWVYERAKRSSLVERVIVATDDGRIHDAVRAFGGEAVMTSPAHATGTDRIAEVARSLFSDLIVNVQGDEPLIKPEMIDQAIEPMIEDPSIPISTLATKITDAAEAFDPNVVKVVTGRQGSALYFSRAPIPWDRERWTGKGISEQAPVVAQLLKHIGLYVYRRDFLLAFAGLPPTPLENVEKLEQLRALEYGHRIRVVTTEHQSFGVDMPDDLGKILNRLDAGGEEHGG